MNKKNYNLNKKEPNKKAFAYTSRYNKKVTKFEGKKRMNVYQKLTLVSDI